MSNEPKIERITIDDKEVDVAVFSMPMYHEDWHEVEKLGLKLAHISSEGGDYWDSSLYFAKLKDVEKVAQWFNC